MRCACWMNKGRQALLRIAFLGYLVLMLWLLFGQRFTGELTLADWDTFRGLIGLEPLKTIKGYIWVLENSGNRTQQLGAVINLLGNVVMFLPFGYFLGKLFVPMRNFWRMLVLSTVVICSVELLQAATMMGKCDIDDLILNLPAIVLGWIFWRTGHKK